jgi:hypothetical protein
MKPKLLAPSWSKHLEENGSKGCTKIIRLERPLMAMSHMQGKVCLVTGSSSGDVAVRQRLWNVSEALTRQHIKA